MSTQPIRVMLIEDCTVVRQGFEALLRNQPGIKVVGRVADGDQALEQAAGVQPDVALIDTSLPGLDWLEVTRELRRRCPECKVLILAAHAGDESVVQAFRAGAHGFFAKDVDAESVIEAVRRVAAGHNYLTPFASRALIERVKTGPQQPPTGVDLLTDRERQIWRLIAEGKTTLQIAEKLGVSVKTIRTHRSNLMNKLGIHDQTSLVKEISFQKEMPPGSVYVVAKSPTDRDRVCRLVRSHGLRVRSCCYAQEFPARYDASRPGCLLFVADRPEEGHFDLLEQLPAYHIDVPAIMVATHWNKSTATRATRLGAEYYSRERVTDEVLLERIRDALRKNAFRREQMSRHDAFMDNVEKLTPRERQVLNLVVSGMTDQQIAAVLGISEKTVRTHRRRILDKMQ